LLLLLEPLLPLFLIEMFLYWHLPMIGKSALKPLFHTGNVHLSIS
jgi:hypothetical protein